MEKKFFTGMAVLLLGASLFFVGCGDSGDDDGVNDPVLSGTAALGTGATVKGVAVVFAGSETGADLDHAVTGTVAIATSALGGNASTTFAAADSGTSKAVYVAPGGTAPTETTFGDAAEYADATALAAGGVFFVKVTSQNGSAAKWYKITVLEDVKAVYSLKTTEGAAAQPDTASGLEILSAVKDGTGDVAIKLGGTLAESFVYTTTTAGGVAYPAADPAVDFPARGFWIGSSDEVKPAAGKYSDAYIQGFFSGLAADHSKYVA
ncbi:MAG: hypothetical protein LBK61_12135, partial [Spirochaetaceae bacterium]|nr:hypothetical protein [Spirochaetaceae bacterium]